MGGGQLLPHRARSVGQPISESRAVLERCGARRLFRGPRVQREPRDKEPDVHPAQYAYRDRRALFGGVRRKLSDREQSRPTGRGRERRTVVLLYNRHPVREPGEHAPCAAARCLADALHGGRDHGAGLPRARAPPRASVGGRGARRRGPLRDDARVLPRAGRARHRQRVREQDKQHRDAAKRYAPRRHLLDSRPYR